MLFWRQFSEIFLQPSLLEVYHEQNLTYILFHRCLVPNIKYNFELSKFNFLYFMSTCIKELFCQQTRLTLRYLQPTDEYYWLS
jgi:hypothetical protein